MGPFSIADVLKNIMARGNEGVTKVQQTIFRAIFLRKMTIIDIEWMINSYFWVKIRDVLHAMAV